MARADSLRTAFTRVVAVSAACSCTLLAVSCGTSAQKREAQQLKDASVLANTAPLGDRLIKQSEVSTASDTAGAQTFLHFWSLLQYGAWDEAAQLFEPGLRDAMGLSLLTEALENDLIVWQATKPKIVDAREISPGMTTIRFLARDERDNVVPSSISLFGAAGKWRVSYFPLLNPALARAADERVQAQIDPLATKPSPEAVRQANLAGNIQANYLELKLRTGRAKP
jgi:hypothetical protein